MAEKYIAIRKSNDDDEEALSDASSETFHTSQQQQFQSLRKSKLVTHLLLLLTCFAFLTNLYFLLRNSKTVVNLQDGLYPHLIPPMPLQTTIFAQQKIYSEAPSPESDQAWDDLLPPGRGYVFVRDGQSRGLPQPGEMTSSGEIYSVTLFHQIHCLGMLRTNYWELLNRAAAQDDLESLRKFATLHQKSTHANHCFDYLRQSLQCNADMSLEWPAPGTKTVDGWGVPHLCKNWDAVMVYMEKNHFNASKRHDIAGE